MICIYDSKETDFNNNGLVVLSDCKSFFTTEKLNGEYEVELEYPLDSQGKWKYILEDEIVKNSEGQLFRIYNKKKTLSGIKANARHIFYDLLDNFLEDVRPTNISGYGALDWILKNTQYSHPFIANGDVGGNSTRYFVRKNVVEAILGKEGIINTWGGEIVRDNFIIKLLNARGLDRGVLVSYGKNIQGIEETLDIDSICTRLMPKGKDGLLLTEKYIDSQYINNFSHPKIKMVEFSDIEDEETLRSAAIEYMISNKIDIPLANYKVDFIELSKTVEYKNYAILERVYLGDIVTIRHSKLGMDLKAKVISIKKNDLTKRIEKIELGSFKPNLATAINNSIQEVKKEIEQSTTFLEEAITNATNLINNTLGGYVVKRNGELLIMDTEDIMTATKVWRWNQGGLGYSKTGYNGPYETAITQDGSIVANFITTGILNAGLIKAGLLKSFNGASWINMEDGTFSYGNGSLKFDGANLSMETTDGTYGTKMSNGAIEFKVSNEIVGGVVATRFADNELINGLNIANAKNGDYTDIGFTDSDDFRGGSSFTPVIRIANIIHELLGNFKGIQLLENVRLKNSKKFYLESNDSKYPHEIYNENGFLYQFGNDGIALGYKNGAEKVNVIEVFETPNETGTQVFINKQMSMLGNNITSVNEIFRYASSGRYYHEGWCGSIEATAKRISNLNVFLDSGWYAYSDGANGAPSNYGIVLHFKWNSGDFVQIAFDFANTMYQRAWVNGAWTSWTQR